MRRSSQKILVVEDDPFTMQAIEIKLKREGFEVLGAVNYREGLKKMRTAGPVAAIFLDLRMPRGNGFNFLEEHEKDTSLRQVPVIVFSNLSQREYVERALGLGVKGYLVKANHTLEEIVGELKKCLDTGVCRIDFY